MPALISFHLRARRVLLVEVEALLALLGREGREVRASHGGPSVRHARAHVHAHAEHLPRALRDLEVDHVQARRIGRAERDRGVHLVGELLHERPREVAHVERAEIRVAEREHAHRERIALGVGRAGEISHLHQREGEAAHRGLGQPRARGDLAVAELAVLAREAAQDVEAARERRDELAVLARLGTAANDGGAAHDAFPGRTTTLPVIFAPRHARDGIGRGVEADALGDRGLHGAVAQPLGDVHHVARVARGIAARPVAPIDADDGALAKQREVDRHLRNLAGREAHDEEATLPRGRAERGLRVRAAHCIEDDVDAAFFRERIEAAAKILGRVVHRLVGAVLAAEVELRFASTRTR